MNLHSTKSLLLVSLWLTCSAHASYVLTGATVTENFNGGAVSLTGNFTTNATFATAPGAGLLFGGGAGQIAGPLGAASNAAFDTQLALMAATDMASALAVVTANGTNQQGKYVNSTTVGAFTTQHLASQSTSVSWTGLMGNLVVGGTNNLTGMSVVWDSAIDLQSTTGGTLTDDVVYNGFRLYYSVGGAVGSFKPVANYLFAPGAALNATMNSTANIVFDSPVAPGTNVYVVWADDNASANADGSFAIDNVSFTGVVPEPSLLSSLLVFGGLALSRRRR